MIIIEQPDDTLWMIRQPDHAKTCAELAKHWLRPRLIPQPIWPRLIEAIRRHDDGWAQEEQAPTLDSSGRPHNFKTIPTAQHVDIWQRTIDGTQRNDPYQGLIVALHARWLYTNMSPNHNDDATANQFIHEVTEYIDKNIKYLRQTQDQDTLSAVTPSNLKIAQRLLSFFDALSLMMLGAVAWAPTTKRLHYGTHSDPLTITCDEDNGQTVHIDPWPFNADRLTAETTAYRLNQSRFEDTDELAIQLQSAHAEQLHWCITSQAHEQGRDPKA